MLQNDAATLFTITVADDGQGMIETNLATTGVGKINMQQRIQLLNGKVEWQTATTGTTVIIQLPIQPFET